jgi:hypothetical protein
MLPPVDLGEPEKPTTLTLFVAVVSAVADLDPAVPEIKGDAMDQLIEAARAHATDLLKGAAADEAERWESLATAAQVELESRRLTAR